MRLLITGGAGCLGSNLVQHYLPDRHEILVLDNFSTSSRAALPEGVPRLTVVEGNVADAGLVDRLIADFAPTHIVHSAAAYKDPSDWKEDVATNITGTINIVRAAEAAGVARIVNFQTALCYGRPATVPIPVTAPLRPFTSYGISKTAAEQYLLMSAVPAVSLRLANVTGPGLAIGPIPTFYKRLKAGQSCFCSDTVRDFLDMDDFLRAVDIALQEDAPTGVFNISSGEGKSIAQVFDAVIDYLCIRPGQEVPIVPPADDDVPMVVLDPAETERQLGWRAEIDFEESIRRVLRWYDAHGIGTVHSHLKSAPASD